MSHPEIDKYIKDARDNGASDEVIRQELLKVGWPSTDVENAFLETNSTIPASDFKKPEEVGAGLPPSEVQTNLSSPVVSQKPIESTPNIQSVNINGGLNAINVMPNNPHGNMKKIVVALVVVLGLVGLGLLTYFYLIPKFSSRLPYKMETFFGEMVSSVATINSSGYKVSISMKTEELNPDFKSLLDAFPEYAPKDSDPFGSTPYDENEPIITSMIRAEEMYSMFLPSELEANISVEGNIKKIDGEGIKPLGNTGIKASFSTPDFSMSADVELIAKDGALYGKINRLPPLVFISLDAIKGKWVKLIDTATTTLSNKDDLYKDFSNEDKDIVVKILKEFPRVADESNVLSIKSRPKKETINDQVLYRYDVKINPENIVTFYDKMVELVRKEVPAEKLAELEETLALQKKSFNDPSFTKLIDHYQNQSEFSIWISKDEKFPVKISSSGYFVPSRSVLLNSDKAVSKKQIKSTLSFEMLNINQEFNVSIPDEFITLDEAYKILTPDFATTTSKVNKTPIKK